MKKITQHIGQLSGKILVFGGVYSNFQALEKLMEIAKAANISPSNVINTGDIVAYCAEPERCIHTIRDWGIHSILGNVEIQLRDNLEDCGCNFNGGSRCDVFSRQWYPYAQEKVSDDSKEWFRTLPDHIEFDYAGKKIAVIHGNASETSGYVFKSTDWTKKQKNFDDIGVDIILGGHCGLPFSDTKNGQYWLNAGVIGMPANDATTRVWYMILDDMPFSFKHYSFEYDFEKTFDLMQKNNLPAQYAKTLKTGLWDNCEILPEEETAMRGIGY